MKECELKINLHIWEYMYFHEWLDLQHSIYKRKQGVGLVHSKSVDKNITNRQNKVSTKKACPGHFNETQLCDMTIFNLLSVLICSFHQSSVIFKMDWLTLPTTDSQSCCFPEQYIEKSGLQRKWYLIIQVNKTL